MSPQRDDDGGLAGVGVASAKGAVLIAVAVVVGIVLLGRGFDSGILPETAETPSEQADGAEAEAEAEIEDGGEDGTVTTPTTVTAVTQALDQVRVIALNATGSTGQALAGVAGSGTEALQEAGYSNTLPGANTTPVATSSVLFAPGLEADAAAVATALALPPTAVEPLPTPLPVGVPPEAQVVVVLGDDTTFRPAG
ncbi:MAG: LytR C-terminal domain-containing protein [Acidimicrobiia bacterium]|nr:LytR C-terminal domain-containing protein [Acidimicrobiia bacterium]